MSVFTENRNRKAALKGDVKELTHREVWVQLNCIAKSWGGKELSENMLNPVHETSMRKTLRGCLPAA